MNEWMPIETAPKDGTPLLLYGGDHDSPSDYWGEELPSNIAVAWFCNKKWRYCSYHSGYYGEWVNPTHWMPLPNPPA